MQHRYPKANGDSATSAYPLSFILSIGKMPIAKASIAVASNSDLLSRLERKSLRKTFHPPTAKTTKPQIKSHAAVEMISARYFPMLIHRQSKMVRSARAVGSPPELARYKTAQAAEATAPAPVLIIDPAAASTAASTAFPGSLPVAHAVYAMNAPTAIPNTAPATAQTTP